MRFLSVRGFYTDSSHGLDLSWIHLPVPKDRDDEAYLLPLRKLLPALHADTDLHLWLVHEYDLESTMTRLLAAKNFFGERRFGTGTKCGLGRLTKDDLESVLDIERALCSV